MDTTKIRIPTYIRYRCVSIRSTVGNTYSEMTLTREASPLPQIMNRSCVFFLVSLVTLYSRSTRNRARMTGRLKIEDMMVREEAHAGALEGNPIREDIEEAAAICGVDYLVNVVLNEHKEIIRAVAGDVTQAHRAGCAFLDGLYLSVIDRRADIVIVSQGGAPKDLNLYQTQKALDNAKHAVKTGGVVILVGSCREGLGEKTFEDWMLRAEKPEDLIRWIQENFKLGGHKAAAIAMTQRTAELGGRYSPEFVCSPFKFNLGNYLEALEQGANVLFQTGLGCRYGYYGELQEQILRDLGYQFRFVCLSRQRAKPAAACEQMRQLGCTLPSSQMLYVLAMLSVSGYCAG